MAKDYSEQDTGKTAAKWQTMSATDAFSKLSSPIMIADSDLTIRYVNEAAYEMFEAIEADIRTDLPHFKAREIVGRSIDTFHKNPAHQRKLIAGMQRRHDSSFVVGGKTLNFKANPQWNDDGQLEALLVEWQDMTLAFEGKRQIEQLINEIGDMADAHNAGHINTRLDADQYNEKLADLADRVNGMVADHIATKRRIIACAGEYAAGNFDAQIDRYTGDRAFITEAMDGVRDNFRHVTAEIKDLSQAIVEGRLDREVHPEAFHGEFRDIVEAFGQAYSCLSDTLATVSQQIDQVAVTVGQISSSAQALADTSQTTSNAVSSVSSAALETNQQVMANADSAENARRLVVNSSRTARDGASGLVKMVEAMDSIRASSTDIARIIRVIDEIAFQTNLLALNAAVEAARAGTHGRGFAVVAQEVRNLAGRSAKAARETSDLIEASTSCVEEGVRIAGQTRDSFTAITSDIGQAETLMTAIAAASQEQAKGVSHISQSMGHVAEAAYSTSSQADQLAASSTQMQAATEMMRDALKRFRLKRNSAVEVSYNPDVMEKVRAMVQAHLSRQRLA